VTYRQIFTDGRPLPQNPDPSWNGFSAGTWEGDTLVAHTVGLRDGAWLDRKGSPLTDAAKITERFHRINYGINLSCSTPSFWIITASTTNETQHTWSASNHTVRAFHAGARQTSTN
jgi:hypothetical protein